MSDVREAAMVLFRDKAGLILVLRRHPEDRAYPSEEGAWSLPGGKVDKHETPARAAVRELREETGIEGVLSPHGVRETTSPTGRQYRISLFCGQSLAPASVLPVRLSNEHCACEWVTGEEALLRVDRTLMPVTWDFLHEVVSTEASAL